MLVDQGEELEIFRLVNDEDLGELLSHLLKQMAYAFCVLSCLPQSTFHVLLILVEICMPEFH